MHIVLTETFDEDVEKAIELAKANNLVVIFERDGIHGTDDLRTIVKFQNAGFSYRIKTYKGKYDEDAICVEFMYIPRG